MQTLLERSSVLPAAARREAAVSGETYSRLINLAGRRRFTSQRVVLFAVLAAQGREGALEVSQEALGIFVAANRALVQGGDGLPGLFCAELQQAHHGARGHGPAIDAFITLARRTHDAIAAGLRSVPALLDELVAASTPLLAALNAITQVYEDLGRRHARHERERLADVMHDIGQIARQARIVSFNAQVVAARAPGGGREFAVVASELLQITSRMEEMVREATRGD